MTKQPTDQQIIERLATDVMKWKKENDFDDEAKDYWSDGHISHGYVDSMTWNPLEDENDFRMVLEKIMENEKLWATFCGNVWCMGSGGLDVMHYSDETAAMSQYMKAGLRLRCVCLIIALDSLQDSPPQV